VIAVHRVCPLDRVTAVLTDDEAEPGAHEALTSAGVTLLRASGAQRPSLTEAG
jgi:DeoR/GlpR family transcriptional regulator of sugar metabolism